MADEAKVVIATNLANWIPDIWSLEVLSAVENSLVAGALCDRTYEAFARGGGNNIVVPNLAEITANAVNTSLEMTLYDTVQNVTNIALNIKYDIGVVVDDINQMQSNPKYFEKVRSKLAYGLAKQIDTNVCALYKGLDYAAGTVNVALTEDVLLEAYEYLNVANAPYEDRHWVIDPESITDLYKFDMFSKWDYTGDVPWKTGFVGRQILGAPVYVTTNLDTYAGGPHAGAYKQREAIALTMQMAPKFEVARIPLQHGDALIGLCVYGVTEMRGTFGVCINTRS